MYCSYTFQFPEVWHISLLSMYAISAIELLNAADGLTCPPLLFIHGNCVRAEKLRDLGVLTAALRLWEKVHG